ncbi:hypothetical protein BGW38_007665, partial [Lunasporangiospora selenospora]
SSESWIDSQNKQLHLQQLSSSAGTSTSAGGDGGGGGSGDGSGGNGSGGEAVPGSSYESQASIPYTFRRGSFVEGEDPRPTIPEFETIREAMYEYAGCNLLMDFARVSTPSRPG